MLCDKCGKNKATTHIKQIINGVAVTRSLCSECAAKEGYGGIGGGSLHDMLASVFGDITPNGTAAKKSRCPVCGADFSDIAATGKVGCAECYKTFLSELLPYLKRIHGRVKHTGKIPTLNLNNPDYTESTEELKNQLKKLIDEERFEEAAVLRDKIKELEGKSNE